MDFKSSPSPSSTPQKRNADFPNESPSPKKPHNQLRAYITDAVEELNTEIKATSYDLLKQHGSTTMSDNLDRIRRKLAVIKHKTLNFADIFERENNISNQNLLELKRRQHELQNDVASLRARAQLQQKQLQDKETALQTLFEDIEMPLSEPAVESVSRSITHTSITSLNPYQCVKDIYL
jgi:hypothetical protein